MEMHCVHKLDRIGILFDMYFITCSRTNILEQCDYVPIGESKDETQAQVKSLGLYILFVINTSNEIIEGPKQIFICQRIQ